MLVKSSQVSPLVTQQQVQPLVSSDTVDSFIGKFGAPTAAYSLRDLNDSRDNNWVVRVRRVVDDLERNFKAADLTDGTITAWVMEGVTLSSGLGATISCVSKWYDQSGNNNHAVQTDPNLQPRITEGVPIRYLDGVKFDGYEDYFDISSSIPLSNGTPLSVFCVQSPQTGHDRFTLGSATSNRGISFKTTKVFYYFSKKGISIHAHGHHAAFTLFSVIHDGTSHTLNGQQTNNYAGENVIANRNGSKLIDSTPDADMGSEQHTNSIDYVGHGVPANRLRGELKELIIYTTDKTASRGAMEIDIANANGIPF